ncbi:MAG: ankyrin repeat domain-containing protein [Holosporales bacterium]|jgi:ankyrin repeat protein|nr:ankyrin repeat domain-containing protein [Holosporales bacterium]
MKGFYKTTLFVVGVSIFTYESANTMEQARSVFSGIMRKGRGFTSAIWDGICKHKEGCVYAVVGATALLLDSVAVYGNRGKLLLLAAEYGYTKFVKVLLCIANVNARDNNGYTPLHRAAREGHAGTVQVLVDAGANRDARAIDGCTPLHWAAHRGHTEVVKILLNAGANKDAKDIDGYTPLHCVAFRRHTEVVKILLAAGASKEAKDNLGRAPRDVIWRWEETKRLLA